MSILNDLDHIRRRMREIASPPPGSIAASEADGLLRDGDTKQVGGYTYAFDGRHWRYQPTGKS